MGRTKNYWYVLVMTNSGPIFVTKVNHSDKTAEWNKDDKPLKMSMESAKDLAMGLMANLNFAFAVCNYFELENQPYRYNMGKFEWKPNSDT